jgi:hypothetical protein
LLFWKAWHELMRWSIKTVTPSWTGKRKNSGPSELIG